MDVYAYMCMYVRTRWRYALEGGMYLHEVGRRSGGDTSFSLAGSSAFNLGAYATHAVCMSLGLDI